MKAVRKLGLSKNHQPSISLSHLVAHVHSVNKAVGLEVVECQLVADSRVTLSSKAPGIFIKAGRIRVRLLLLLDEAHELPGFTTGLQEVGWVAQVSFVIFASEKYWKPQIYLVVMQHSL